jgi:glycosyltransferase involved in cell wall biosynthesis
MSGARARPRIGVVAASLAILGGQGVQAAALMRELRADGWEVTFVPINPAFPRPLARLRRWPYVRTGLNEAIYAGTLARLARVDVVHVFSAAYWSFLLGPALAIAAGRALGKRVILNYHSGEADDHLRHWGVRVHPWLRAAHEIVVPSEYLREVFARHGYRTRVVANVVDLRRFRYRERIQLAPRLLSTRNLEAYYRVDVTLEAFALVRERYPDATLTIAGTGSLEPALRRRAQELGMRGIRFAGRVEPEHLPRLCDTADIFVNASVVDNQPVSVLEAFAAGLPVVSTPTGDLANLVRDRETGLVVPTLDPDAAAKAVLALLERPDLAREIARRGREEVGRFTWPRVRDSWADVYAPRT